MVHVSATHRCSLFEQISEQVWAEVIHNHRARMPVSEIGITYNIIASIRNHSSKYSNFGVWSNRAYNETLYGSDIDIFVETKVGHFLWYALQAKALQTNGQYHDMAVSVTTNINGTN